MLRRLTKDIAVYGSADLLFRAAQFLAIPVYAHQLSVDDFALMALLATSVTLLGLLLNLGINNAVQRFYFDPDVPEAKRQTLITTGLAQLLLTGIVAVSLGALLLSTFGNDIERNYKIPALLAGIALATVLPEQLTQYLQDVVRLHFAPMRYLLISLFRNLLGVLIGLWLLIEWELGVAGVLLGTLIGALSALPLGLFLIRKDLGLQVDRTMAIRTFRYGYPFVFTGAAFWIFGSMDRWMLLELSTVTQVGLFSIAMKFAAAISFVTFAFGRAWSPMAFKLFGEDPDYRSHFTRVFSGWFFLLATIGLTISLFAPELFRSLTPREYWPAAAILSFVAVGLVLEGTTQITTLGISLARRTIFLTYGAWLAAATNVALNIALIPRFGAMGSATATLISYAVLTSALLMWSQRLHPIALERSKLLYSCGILVVALAVPLYLSSSEPSPLALAAKIGIIAMVLLGGIMIRIVDLRLLAGVARSVARPNATGSS